MKKPIPLFQVDAFAHQPFTGNPAAVCLLQSPKDSHWMQSVAAEMNLSETAFVQRREDPKEGFDLRWFTPTVEVDLCGHATLATAHILWQQEWLGEEEKAYFHTKSGVLIAEKNKGKITLDFPATLAQTVATQDIPAGLLPALGLDNSQGTIFFDQVDYLVLVDHESMVRELHPDFVALSAINSRGVIVTALANVANTTSTTSTSSTSSTYDFISRFFGPASGIDEDPVTGSAHCTLAPFWAERLNKNSLRAFQASRRGGEVDMDLQKDRVLLSGEAITVFSGELYV